MEMDVKPACEKISRVSTDRRMYGRTGLELLEARLIAPLKAHCRTISNSKWRQAPILPEIRQNPDYSENTSSLKSLSGRLALHNIL
jgi:hypothetical protein